MHRLHVVIGGYGRVGRYLARMLEFEGHTVSVIDQDPLVFECEEEDEILRRRVRTLLIMQADAATSL